MLLFNDGAATLRDREANLGWCWGDGRPSLSEQIEQYYAAQTKEREVDDCYAERVRQHQIEICYETEACYEIEADRVALDAQREVENYLDDELVYSAEALIRIDGRPLALCGQQLVA